MSVYVPRICDHETACRIGPEARAVFASQVDQQGHWFAPLLSVDLSAVNPAWSGRGHFLFWEEPGRLTMELAGALCTVRQADFARITEMRVDDGMDGLEEPPSSWTGRHFELQSTDPDPDDPAGGTFGFFGGQCQWLQSGQVPLAADGSPMGFVGQIWMDRLAGDLPDFVSMLFHSPDDGVLVQVVQTS